MFCPQCGHENPATGKFCQHCGTPLSPAKTPLPTEGRSGKSTQPAKATIATDKEEARLRQLVKATNTLGITFGLLAVIVVVYFGVGPGAKGGGIGNNNTAPPVTTTTSTVNPPLTTTTGKTLVELLGLSADITSMKYDLLVTGPGLPTTSTKTWLKKNKMKTEVVQQGTTAVMLIDNDAKTMYSYMPAQNMAIKLPFDPAKLLQSPADDIKAIQNNNAKVIGTETVDGKICTVVQYSGSQGTVKTWVWQDKGLPIRSEVTSSTGKTVIEYGNLDFSDIPDSTFVLPAGVKIM